MKFLFYLGFSVCCMMTGAFAQSNFNQGQNFVSSAQNQRPERDAFVTDVPNNANIRSVSQPEANEQNLQNQFSVDHSFFGSGNKRKKTRDAFLNYYYTTYQTNRNIPLLRLRQYERTIDGSENNIQHPLFGSTNQPLLRKGRANYLDGLSIPNVYSKTPREISNYLGVMNSEMQLALNGKLSMLFTIWGQFIDHDITLTETLEGERMNIPIPWCDQIMDRNCTGDQNMDFKRSKYDENSRPRNQINEITAWMDASNVYGSDQKTAHQLRTFQGGRLQVTSENLLPSIIEKGFKVFYAGDIRANQNVILTTFHTVFVRQHNRVCRLAESQSSESLADEELYQIGKNYVTSLIQKITYDDFLPILLGKEAFDKYIGNYLGYNLSTNPGIFTEFSTAAFRIGHSLLVHKYKYMGEDKVVAQELLLRDLFFQPGFINNDSMLKLIRGAKYTPSKKKDVHVIDEIRNSLIPGPNNREMKLDLYSLNIQRAKDHGLPYLNEIRLVYGLPEVRSFRQIVKDEETVRKLQIIYQTPNSCDLWIAIIAEDSLQGGILGQLGARIVGQQFQKIRDGDRFWYESVLSAQILQQIKNTTIEDIFVRNLGLESEGKNIFYIEEQS